MSTQHPARWAAITALLILAFCAESYAQQPRMMLGAPDQVPDRLSPTYNIRYNDGAFTDPRPNIIRKSRKYIINHGASQDVAASFTDQANTITADSDWFGKMIDQAWQSRQAAFLACGGAWADAAMNTLPSDLFITVQPTLWQVQAYGSTMWVRGETDPVGGNRYSIKAVNLYVDGILSDPSTAYTVQFGPVVEWEIGNALGFAAGYHPSDVSKEIGSNSPCAAR